MVQITLTLKTSKKTTFPTGGTIKDTVVNGEDPEAARLAVLSGDGNFIDESGNEVSPLAKRMGLRFIA